MSTAYPPRTYRSSRRNKPCDRCREAKIRCRVVAGSQCARCQQNGTECIFSGSWGPRLPPHTAAQHSDALRTRGVASEYDQGAIQGAPCLQSPPSPAMVGCMSQLSQGNDSTLSAQPTIFGVLEGTGAQLNTQFTQSLEGMQGHAAQLFGSSSESDPWLLRHCRFDDFGARTFQSTQYRSAGGLPLPHKIPIHFMIEPNELLETAKDETRAYAQEIASREELERIVPPECGQRLVAV